MILHVDMDAFFASVEQRDRPELRGQPLVVGGLSGRGVVAAASYEARRYGIHSAMPMFMARTRCPNLTIVSPRKGRYSEVSRSVMAILARYSPVVEQVSIDEAYLDAAGCDRLYGPPPAMARAIKAAIREETRLTCSIGIAPLKFLSKIASDMNKPDGLTVIEPHQVPGFIAALPVAKVPGVGRQAREQLTRMGIVTLGDVVRLPPTRIIDRLGKFGHRLVALAHGHDDTTLTPHRPTKSISTERTLAADTRDREMLRQHLLAQSQEVGRQLRRQGYYARTITLKIKDAAFRQITRSATLARHTQSSTRLFQTAGDLLAQLPLDKPVRLIGIGASSLVDENTPRQASLFPEPGQHTAEWERVDRAMDRIAERFGKAAVHRGSLSPVDDLEVD
jgi:DNA polymerase IV